MYWRDLVCCLALGRYEYVRVSSCQEFVLILLVNLYDVFTFESTCEKNIRHKGDVGPGACDTRRGICGVRTAGGMPRLPF